MHFQCKFCFIFWFYYIFGNIYIFGSHTERPDFRCHFKQLYSLKLHVLLLQWAGLQMKEITTRRVSAPISPEGSGATETDISVPHAMWRGFYSSTHISTWQTHSHILDPQATNFNSQRLALTEKCQFSLSWTWTRWKSTICIVLAKTVIKSITRLFICVHILINQLLACPIIRYMICSAF